MFHWFTVPPAFSYLKLQCCFVPAACCRIWQSGCFTSQAGQGCVTAGCACTWRTERGLLAGLPPESAVLARPEAVLVTANVLRLRLSRVRIGRGRLLCLSPEHVFSMRGAYLGQRQLGTSPPPSTLVPCEGCISRGLLFNLRGASSRVFLSQDEGCLREMVHSSGSAAARSPCQSVVFHSLHPTKKKGDNQ